MRKWQGLLLAALTSAVSGSWAETVRIGDFGLIDHQGKFHQITRYGDVKAILLVVQASGCPTFVEALPRLKALRQEWEPQGVAFLLLNPTSGIERVALSREAEVYDIDFPILMDHSQLVAESLDVDRAGEILLIEPATMKLAFRGPLDERKRRGSDPDKPTPLADALRRAVAGESGLMETVVVPLSSAADTEASAAACAIDFPARVLTAAAAPDYASEIAPILQENCTICHSSGGIAPFAMDSYQMVRGWSYMMKEVLLTRRMPPAQVDPAIGHFTNARYLSDADLQTLVHWIDQGAPRGEGEDPLLVEEALTAQGSELHPEWPLGEPDYIVNVPTQQIPATGVIDYIDVTIDLPFDEDKWVKAVHFRPGDPKVMHHLLTYVVPADYQRGTGTTPRSERRFLEGYAPGKTDYMTYPNNAGVYVPKGYKLTMQLHYTSYGKATEDSTRLGLYFHDTPPEHEFHNESVAQGEFVIPPGATEYTASQQHVFDKDIVLYGLRPHMHYRGRYFKFKVIYPDDTSEDLLSVPNYNFAWQPTYQLESPKVLPAGSRVVVSGAWDNSAWNPGNPDPSKAVIWGDQSWDEMFIGYFAYHFVDRDAVRE